MVTRNEADPDRPPTPAPVASPAASPDGSHLDSQGRYRAHGQLSYAVLGAYAVMIALIVFIVEPRSSVGTIWVPIGLIAVTGFFLVRYASVHYTIDDTTLRAAKLLGRRLIPLEEVRRIEFSGLRDLAPTGGWFGVGSWGWRGRMWSPVIGEFDSIYTDPARGLLVTAGGFPLYLSPSGRDAFVRELSRRVRSYTGPLAKDVGAPGAPVQ